MKENPEFIGRMYGEEEKAGARGALQKWAQESLAPVEGELEKTPQDIETIKIVNELVKKELEYLGIDNCEPINPDSVHMLPTDIFEKKFPKGVHASFRSTDEMIFVDKGSMHTEAHLLAGLLHESFHHASMRKFHATPDGGISGARTGYEIHSVWKDPSRQDRFRGWNEVMVEYTTYLLLTKHRDELGHLGIRPEETQGAIYSYMRYGPIIDAVVKKVSDMKNLPPIQVFEDFKRGQFENTILVLKDVEKAFGKSSLEILSYLETLPEEQGEKLDSMIQDFFMEEDERARAEKGNAIRRFYGSAFVKSE